MRLKLAATLAVSAGCLALAAPLLTQPASSGAVPQDQFEAFSPFWFRGGGTELSMVVNNTLGKEVAFTFELRDAKATRSIPRTGSSNPTGTWASPSGNCSPQA